LEIFSHRAPENLRISWPINYPWHHYHQRQSNIHHGISHLAMRFSLCLVVYTSVFALKAKTLIQLYAARILIHASVLTYTPFVTRTNAYTLCPAASSSQSNRPPRKPVLPSKSSAGPSSRLALRISAAMALAAAFLEDQCATFTSWANNLESIAHA